MEFKFLYSFYVCILVLKTTSNIKVTNKIRHTLRNIYVQKIQYHAFHLLQQFLCSSNYREGLHNIAIISGEVLCVLHPYCFIDTTTLWPTSCCNIYCSNINDTRTYRFNRYAYFCYDICISSLISFASLISISKYNSVFLTLLRHCLLPEIILRRYI